MTTSVHGRRLGLQVASTKQTGGKGTMDFIVGPKDIRLETSTDDSTSANVDPYGYSYLPGTSAASSAVYTLDPPVPGVSKVICGPIDNGPVYVKTANSETIVSTVGSSFTTVKISSLGGAISLVGMTTSMWLAIGLTSGTSSQASGFTLSTST